MAHATPPNCTRRWLLQAFGAGAALTIPAAGWAGTADFLPQRGTGRTGETGGTSGGGAGGGSSAPLASSAFPTLPLTGIDGSPLPMGWITGRVVLVVNVASYCGYTTQYTDLEALWTRFRDRGLTVLGVPCNQFGDQEPGTNNEIRNFCSTRYGVTFPMLAKQDVNGPNRSPLYRVLVESPVGNGQDIEWNFEKFLVGRDGHVLARFPSWQTPMDPTLLAAVEFALSR